MSFPDCPTFGRFWGNAFRHAFTKGWIAVGAVGTILSVIAPFLRAIDPKASDHQVFWDAFDRYGLAWISIGIFWLVVLGRFIWGPYWVYSTEVHQLRQVITGLERQITSETPYFEGEINNIVFAEEWTPRQQLVGTRIFAEISVRNLGSPSIAEGWRLAVHLVNPNRLLEDQPTGFTGDSITLGKGGEQGINLRQQDMIYEKTVVPVPSGGLARGWAQYCFRDVRMEELSKVGTRYVVTFRDVRAKDYQATHIATVPSQSQRTMAMPGSRHIVVERPSTPPSSTPDKGTSPPSPA